MVHPLREFLEEIGARLRSDAMAKRVQGHWDDPASRPEVRIAPPASAAELAGLEAAIGHPLPATLREVLGEVSRGIELVWVLRGHMVPASWGGMRAEITARPPERFLHWSHAPDPDGTYPPEARRSPAYISGGLRFSLEGVRRAVESRPGWVETYAPDGARDAEEAAHLRLIQEFMQAGLPVMTAPNGDWLAIDLRDGREAMMHVSHEGEEAGIEIDLDLPRLLAHLAWLGPVWPDFSEIFAFSEALREVVPGDPRVREARFGAESGEGVAWRAWFWGMNPPRLPEALAGRLG